MKVKISVFSFEKSLKPGRCVLTQKADRYLIITDFWWLFGTYLWLLPWGYLQLTNILSFYLIRVETEPAFLNLSVCLYCPCIIPTCLVLSLLSFFLSLLSLCSVALKTVFMFFLWDYKDLVQQTFPYLSQSDYFEKPLWVNWSFSGTGHRV